MVTELVQYLSGNIRLTRLEAEALLAGIMLDTKNFVSKAGVRTFEAAAYLLRLGAETSDAVSYTHLLWVSWRVAPFPFSMVSRSDFLPEKKHLIFWKKGVTIFFGVNIYSDSLIFVYGVRYDNRTGKTAAGLDLSLIHI